MKRKKERLLKKVSSRFEDMLDIRSLVDIHTNLALLLPLLLTDEQALLFKHQIARTLRPGSRKKPARIKYSDSLLKATGRPGSKSKLPKLTSLRQTEKLDHEALVQLQGLKIDNALTLKLLDGLLDSDIAEP